MTGCYCDNGWVVINPDWPNGVEPYAEPCIESHGGLDKIP